MKAFLNFTISALFCFPALAATNKDSQYKVESTENNETLKTNEDYSYDSLEESPTNKQFPKTLIWTLRPKISFATGLHADKAYLKGERPDLLVNSINLRFFVHPWNRWNGGVQFLQSNKLFLQASWEIMPSREKNRSYYGVGLAHLFYSEKEFSNLVDKDTVHITAHYGWEFLRASQQAWNVELKGFYANENYAFQMTIGYLFPL